MEKNSRFEAGMASMRKMFSAEMLEAMSNMKNISPDFWEMIVAFGFGEVYTREGLSLDKREIVTLTSLITQGAFDQLEVHLRAALNVGLTKEDIIEIIIQCAAYSGFPKACQAMMIAGTIFESLE
jgi:4-carboxymuconolactone decarboxylase